MRGHFQIEARASMFVVVMAVLDDHHSVVMMPAVVAMFAILGACAAIIVAIAVLDNDGFGTGDRRRRYSDGNDGRDDVSKLLHDVLLLRGTRLEHQARRNVPDRSGENSERMFRVSTDSAGWAKPPLRHATSGGAVIVYCVETHWWPCGVHHLGQFAEPRA